MNMLKLIVLMMVLSFQAHADGIHIDNVDGNCTLPNGNIIPNCDVVPGPNGENPNILVQWTRSTQRENSEILPIEEVGGVKVYFQDVENNWWTAYDTLSATTENLFIYKPPATYSFTMTTYDTFAKEGPPTAAIVAVVGGVTVPPPPPVDPGDPPIVDPVRPKPPVIISFTLPPSTAATIHLTPHGAAQ